MEMTNIPGKIILYLTCVVGIWVVPALFNIESANPMITFYKILMTILLLPITWFIVDYIASRG